MRNVKRAIVLSILISCISIIYGAEPLDSIHHLNNVVVTGTRNATDVRHLPFTVDVIGREKLTENHRMSILPTLTEQIPGLFVTSRSMLGYGVPTNAAGSISLRGISGSNGQMMVLIDGHPQYQGIYGHPISDSYQTLMVDHIEVIHGPASMLYGSNAMGGVINIITRGMHKSGVKTNVNLSAGSYGTFQSEISNQVRSGKFSSTVAANYERSDNQRPNMGFEQYSGYVRLGYNLSSYWNLNMNANITHFNASNPGMESQPLFDARQWITRGEVSMALENHYRRTSGGISIYSNFGRHKVNDGTKNIQQPQSRYFRSKDALSGISLYQSVNLFSGNCVTIGFDWQNIYGKVYYTSIKTGKTIDTPNKQSGHSHPNEVAGYTDFRQDLNSWLTVDAGIRLDHHSITGSEWVPQGGIVVRPMENGELKAVVSKGFRNPTMREMYLYPPSNTDLRPERLMQYELSWKHRIKERFTYGLNLFYINGDNMIETVSVDGRPRNVNTGKIENTGAELSVSWRINNHWDVNTNHSILHMSHPVLAAPEYKGYLGGDYQKDKWSVHAGLMQIAGLYTITGKNTKKENVTLLNMTTEYQLLKSTHLWVRGENLLAQHYEVIDGFPMPKATFMGGVSFTF